MEEKRGRRIGIRSGVQADEIKRLGGLGERNGHSGHLDALSGSRWRSHGH